MTDNWHELTWDSMGPEKREVVIRRARWVTGKGTLNSVGRRLLRSDWANICDGTRNILIRNAA